VSIVDGAPRVDALKARFRQAYVLWMAHGDHYDCGNAMLVQISSEARRLLTEMVETMDALAAADPDFPASVMTKVDQWRNLLASDRETADAVDELNGKGTRL